MRIIYDVLTKSVLVSFRGTIKMLGPFPDRKTAIDAAEDYCRHRGWGGQGATAFAKQEHRLSNMLLPDRRPEVSVSDVRYYEGATAGFTVDDEAKAPQPPP